MKESTILILKEVIRILNFSASRFDKLIKESLKDKQKKNH